MTMTLPGTPPAVKAAVVRKPMLDADNRQAQSARVTAVKEQYLLARHGGSGTL
jgi:hypothetical protein